MATRDNIVSLNRSGQKSGHSKSMDKNRTIIESCRLAVSRGLGMLCENYFEKLDDALYKLADKAESNDLQTRYFDTMRETRKEREGIEKSFQDTVSANYDNFWRPGSKPVKASKRKDIDYDNLSLIESDVLEEELAISNMVARGENLCMREIYALEQRFGRLQSGITVDNNNNPLSPEKICTAFKSAIDVLAVDIPTKLVIYKVFEQEVVSHLEEVYAGINELMRDAGILPTLKPKIRASKVMAATSGRHVSEDDGKEGVAAGRTPDSASGGGADGATIELFDTLRQLLTSAPQGYTGGAVFNTDQPTAETVQVIKALSALQTSDAVEKTFDPESASSSHSDLKVNLLQQVRKIAGDASIGSVKQIDHDTIDMISMLFEFILDDPKIPDAMKVLLSQLQIPIIKVAILDKGFFSNRAHPARRLLNGLAHAVVGWTDDRSRSKNSLYGMVESIIRRVLSDFSEDIQLFADLADELDSFCKQEQRVSEAAEKRVSQIASGKEQLGMAKRRVKTEIDKRLTAVKNMPLAIVNMLNEGWRDVLTLHFLRHGAKSSEWQDALNAMDSLIDTTQPKQDIQERERIVGEIPGLVEYMRKEMADIQSDQYLMDRLFKDLEKVHVECVRGNEVPEDLLAGKEAMEKALEPKEESKAERPKRESDLRESPKYLKLAKDIPLGSWFELREKGGAKSRIKLLWRSSVSDNCLFVNRKGVKVKEMRLSELALALRVGAAIVIAGSDDPLMDGAFAAMMESLRGSGNPAPAPS